MKQDDAGYLFEAPVVDSVNSAAGVGFDRRGSVVSVCIFEHDIATEMCLCFRISSIKSDSKWQKIRMAPSSEHKIYLFAD